LRERDLEHVMRDFYQQRFNVCSAHINRDRHRHPTAKPIIINRAASSASRSCTSCAAARPLAPPGLCLPALPDEGNITAAATKRLEAIQMMEELGSGFFSPCMISRFAAPAEVLGESQRAKCRRSDSTLRCGCWIPRCDP